MFTCAPFGRGKQEIRLIRWLRSTCLSPSTVKDLRFFNCGLTRGFESFRSSGNAPTRTTFSSEGFPIRKVKMVVGVSKVPSKWKVNSVRVFISLMDL